MISGKEISLRPLSVYFGLYYFVKYFKTLGSYESLHTRHMPLGLGVSSPAPPYTCHVWKTHDTKAAQYYIEGWLTVKDMVRSLISLS